MSDSDRCEGTLGSKPWWMSWGQYDPCRCDLPEGHDGPHDCWHLRSKRAIGDGGNAQARSTDAETIGPENPQRYR